MSNSLSAVHPELIAEWSDKNLPLTPDSVTFGSNKKVWWKGACGHEWETSIKARSNGEKCPICSGVRVVAGINDLSTLKPELASELLSGIFLLPVTMQPRQIKISRNRKQIQQCAVENGTLFSCISFRTRYDERVTKKKERTPSRQRHCSLLPSLLRSNRSRSSMLMIRRFSIFCKLNEINFSDRKWFEDAAGMPLPPDQPCPYCSAKGTLRLFGHYNRYLVEWDGKAQKYSTVTVSRYICDSCGHTHAILPSCIVPYRSYSLRFLLIVLRTYFIRSGSVEHLCGHYGITISMLYRWLRLFQQQKALWLGVLEDMSAVAASFIDSMDGRLLKDFFLAFCFSFMESPRVTDLEMLSRQPHDPDGIT